MRFARAFSLLIILSLGTQFLHAQYLGGAGDGHSSIGGTFQLGCAIPSSERAALDAIYAGMNGSGWIDRTGWNSTDDESTWYGVEVVDCHVVGLQLGDNNLAGEIPVEIQNLTELRELNFSNNYIYGVIPVEVVTLEALTTLNLSVNLLDGSIPIEIGGEAGLVELFLSENNLSGSIPPELGLVSNLQVLDLGFNKFTGTVPAELGDLSQLRELYLQRNHLAGDVPGELSNLANNSLTYADFSFNQFTGMAVFESGSIYLLINDNRLDFEDIEPVVGAIALDQIVYSPQAKLPPGGFIEFTVGDPLIIPFSTGGTANMYQWYQDGGDLPSGSNPTYTKAAPTGNDAGIYELHITNTLVPGLELRTEPYYVFRAQCTEDSRESGMTDTSFAPDIGAPDHGRIVFMQGNNILTSFDDNDVGGFYVDGVYRFFPDGTLDSEFEISGVHPERERFIVQPDKTILIGRNGGTYTYVSKYTIDGDPFPGFNSNSHQWYDGEITSMTVQLTGRIVVSHTSHNTPSYIDRILPNGVWDEVYDNVMNFRANVMRTRSDNKILMGGFDLGTNGELTPAIHLIGVNGGIDNSFTGYISDPEGEIHDIAIQPDGQVIVAGRFRSFNDVPVLSIVRLHPDGSIDESFKLLGLTEDFSLNRVISNVELQPDGKILIAGRFVSYEGTRRVSVARLMSDGSLDCEFDSDDGPEEDNLVTGLAIQPDKKILVSGYFHNYDGYARNGLARIEGEEPDHLTITVQPHNATVCENGVAVFTTDAVGSPDISYSWEYSPDGSAGSFAAIAGENSESITIDPVLPANEGYYRCLVGAEGDVDNYTDEVTLTITTVAPPAGSDVQQCGSGAFTVTATGGSPGQFRWYTTAVAGTAISGETMSTFTTPVLSSSTSYFVSLKPGLCESARSEIVAIVNTLPSAPTVTNGASCGPAVVALNAIGASDGAYRWYTASTGGTAIGGEVHALFTTPSLTTTTTYYVSVDNESCESARTAVTAAINAVPPLPGVTGSSSCTPGTLLLNASGGAAGEYRWYTSATGPSLISGEVNGTYSTPAITSTTTYHVALFNGFCESASRAAVTATINTPASAPVVTGGSRCGPGTVTVSASGAVDGQYLWYNVPAGGTPIAGEVNSSFTTPSISASQSYYVSITGICESARTAVVATIGSNGSAPSVTNGSRCGAGTVGLSASGSTDGNYRWYTVATGGAPIAGEVNAAFITPSLTSTQTYHVSIDNGCESSRTAVTATINPIPALPVTTDASRCGLGTVLLSASGSSNGNYRWYTASSGGTAISGEVNGTFNTPSITSTTSYFAAIDGGGCESARVAATATVNNIPAGPTTTGAAALAPASVTLAASGGSPGQYRWYATAVGGTSIAGEVNGTYVTPVLSTNTTYFVAINDGNCESSRTPVLAALGANTAPVIQRATAETGIKSVVTIPLPGLISDADNNLDFTTLQITEQPVSGAIASIDSQFNLTLDYSGVDFSGTDRLSIRICDVIGACATQEVEVDVMSDVVVFNAVSPNGDDKNPILYIQYIDILPKTKENKVMVMNRWGDVVFEVSNYDNVNRVFRGMGPSGEPLPTGTYYYKIEFADESVPTKTGYLQLNH